MRDTANEYDGSVRGDPVGTRLQPGVGGPPARDLGGADGDGVRRVQLLRGAQRRPGGYGEDEHEEAWFRRHGGGA